MTEFERLKSECKKTYESVHEVYNNLCTDIIFKDIHKIEELMQGRITRKNGEYYLDEEIRIGMTIAQSEVILEFEDKRGTTFLWVFSIELTGYDVTDYFIVDRLPYSVSSLREGEYSDGEEIIKSVIDRLKETKAKIDEKPDINSIEYKYVCVKPDVECMDIESVIKVVLEREPLNC